MMKNEAPKTWKDRDREARVLAQEEAVFKNGVGFLEHAGSKKRFPANRAGKRALKRHERKWSIDRMQARMVQMPKEAEAIAAERLAGEMRRRAQVETEYQDMWKKKNIYSAQQVPDLRFTNGGDPL
jgi:hypothetical protein